MAKRITKKMIDECAMLNARFNETKKQLDAKKKEIKDYCRENNLVSLSGSSFAVSMSERTKYELNQEKAVKIALKANAKWLLKQVIDEQALEEAIRSGEIDGKLFADCWKTNVSCVMTFKAQK